MTPIPHPDALLLQAAGCAGNEPSEGFLEVRAIAPDKRPEQRFVPVRDLHGVIAAVTELRDGHDVFMGVAPRTERRGCADAVARVWTLWADCDGPRSVERLRAIRPLPNIVIDTGTEGHRHAYWTLREPLRPEWARRANLRLAYALGSDRAVADPARVMRVPGTLNRKHDPPRPVRCLRLELDVFRASEVVGHLADEPARKRPRTIRASGGSFEKVAAVVRHAPVGDRNNALNWAAFVAGARVAQTGGEEQARAELHDAAIAVGLDERETLRTVESGLRAGRAA
jgi:hypothetical protein